MSVSKVTFYHLASCKGLCVAKKWSKNRLEQFYQPVYVKVSSKEVQTAVFLEILYSPSISLLSSFPLALFLAPSTSLRLYQPTVFHFNFGASVLICSFKLLHTCSNMTDIVLLQSIAMLENHNTNISIKEKNQ